MATHTATIRWQLKDDESDFLKNRYSRGHVWSLDGGIEVAASASPLLFPYRYQQFIVSQRPTKRRFMEVK
jgi:hypothetical protein